MIGKTLSTRWVALNGVMIAVVFLATRFVSIPGPVAPGYINLGDSMIMLAAILLGNPGAMIIGAFGSALADLAYGAFVFIPVTFIVKGLEGLVIAAIYNRAHPIFGIRPKSNGHMKRLVAVIAGAVVMVAGYFVSELYLLRMVDDAFGWSFAVSELPFNLIQGFASCIVGYILSTVLIKVNILE